MRYKIYKGSVSSHCCFEYTVLDTQVYECVAGRPEDQVGYFRSMCETFDEVAAVQICLVLNKGEGVEWIDSHKERPVDPTKDVWEE